MSIAGKPRERSLKVKNWTEPDWNNDEGELKGQQREPVWSALIRLDSSASEGPEMLQM